jgi:hypothetical protein
MEEAEALDIELDTFGPDLWALEQRATLGARVAVVEEALGTLQQFVAVTKQAVADALVARSARPGGSLGPVRCQRHAHRTCHDCYGWQFAVTSPWPQPEPRPQQDGRQMG